MLVGERFGVRVHGGTVQHRNKAPMFYTAWQPLTYHDQIPEKMLTLNQAMLERFVTRRWTRPLPREGRVPMFPRCARCFARFVCEHGGQQPADGAARG